MEEVYAILNECNIDLTDCNEDDRKARIAADIIVSRMPALTRLFGQYVLAARNIRAFDDAGTVEIPVGTSVRVEGCMYYGTADAVQSAMRVTLKDGRSVCVPWAYSIYLISENKYTKQFVKLIKSNVVIPGIPVSMRSQKFTERPLKPLMPTNTRKRKELTTEREVVGSILIDLSIFAITQSTKQAASGVYSVYFSRAKAEGSYVHAEINLHEWYDDITNTVG